MTSTHLRLLPAAAAPAEKPKISPGDPHVLAQAVIRRIGRDALDRLTLRFWRGEWWKFTDGRYIVVTPPTHRARVTNALHSEIHAARITNNRDTLRQVTKGMCGNVQNAMESLLLVDETVNMPAWIGDAPYGLDPDKTYIAVENGIIGPVGGALHQIRLYFPTPHWFSRVKLPVTYEPFATAPKWEKFLEEVLEGDTELIHLVQEWFGYLCVADTSMQQFLILEGDGQNGKSVLLEVLTAMLGEDNVSHVPLEAFGTRFQLTPTLGKLANIAAEIGELHRTDEGHLKAFVSGDSMYFDRKGILGVDAVPTARLVFATNNRPRFGDRSDGIWRRVVIIPFRYQIPTEKVDTDLATTLKAELPGILNWALEGLERLRANRRFTKPAACAELLAEYRLQNNPARTFLQDVCVEDPQASVGCQALFEQYREWARESGYETLDAGEFGKEVKRAYRKVRRERMSDDGKRQYVYKGLRVR